jgi:hypothetical protein
VPQVWLAGLADLRAVETIGAALDGSGKPFVITPGTLMLTFAGPLGRPGTEQDTSGSGPRVNSENAAVGLAERGGAVLRRPATTDRA